MELSTNPNTVQKAYQELERQGFIYTIKGRGNFVQNVSGLRKERVEEILRQMEKLLSEAEELGERREDLLQQLRGLM
jgi:GntR family transcriptional regulator